MTTIVPDIVYVLLIAGILAGIALVVDGMRRLKNQTTETSDHGGPRMTWIWQKPARVPRKATRR